MIVAIVILTIAAFLSLRLINKTRYSALWISCFIGLIMLIVERLLQLITFDGYPISDLTYAWVGIIVSLCFSIGVVCGHFLVRYVDRMTEQRRILENRLMTAVLSTEERSREGFSRELHDGLGPLLSSAKMSLSALARADLKDKDRAILQNTTAVIDEAIRSLREISNNLSPHILTNFGLASGITNFVDRLAAMHSERILFRTTLRNERFDSNVEVILYRVVCELINNSLKHSGCKSITLNLRVENNRLILDYSDDGRGFNIDEVEYKGMGLSNINSRVSSLNGSFTLRSRVGEGMTAKVVVSTDGSVAHLSGSDYQKLSEMEYDRKKSKNRTRR